MPFSELSFLRLLSAVMAPLFSIVLALLLVWSTETAVRQFNTDAADGVVRPNGNGEVLRHLLGGGSAVAAAAFGPPRETAPAEVRPIASVVVPASIVGPSVDDGLSDFALNRLSQGLRLALLTGAPWLMVVGTAAECAEAVPYLRSQMRGDGLRQLFQGEPSSRAWVTATPMALKPAAAKWACLLSRPDSAEDLTVTGRVPLSFYHHSRGASATMRPRGGEDDVDGGGAGDTTAATRLAEAELASLLETHPLTSNTPQSTRELAAFLVAHHNGGGDDRAGATVAVAVATATPDVTSTAAQDGFVIYGRGGARRPPAGNGNALSYADVPAGALWQYPRLWQVSSTAANECGFLNAAPRHASTSDTAARNGTHATNPSLLMLPGIVTVPLDGFTAGDAPKVAANAFRVLLERSVLARQRQEPADGTAWWLFNKTYGVIALSGGSEARRTQLLYQVAFRRARHEMFASLRRAVATAVTEVRLTNLGFQDKRSRAALSAQSVLPPFLSHGTSLRADYASSSPHFPDVYVLRGAEVPEEATVSLTPGWVSYREYLAKLRALPALTVEQEEAAHSDRQSSRVSLLDNGFPPPTASRLALSLGRYAHYLYYIYCRHRDALKKVLFALNYRDYLSFACDLALDVARGLVDWRDAVLPRAR